MTRVFITTVAAVAALTLTAAGSLSANTANNTPENDEIKLAAATGTKELPPYEPKIEPSKFSANITNPYFPLMPGMVFVYEGMRDGLPRRVEVTVTNETKTIMGVPCIVTRDVVTSKTELVEKTTDWYAQDSDGNVWYFGEDTAEYENGKVTNTHGTWMAGVNGALPGIIMPAIPKVGEGYRQEFLPGTAEDYARVISNVATARVPAGDFEDVLITEDTDLLDRNKFENKSFAKGIGYLGSQGVVNGHFEVVRLVSMLKPN